MKRLVNLMALLGWVGLILLLSSIPHLTLPGYMLDQQLSRKIAHTLVYAMLCLLMWTSLPRPGSNSSVKMVSCFFFCLAVAVLDEVNQLSIPGRNGSWVGVFFDIMGVCWSLAFIGLKNDLVSRTGARLPSLVCLLPDSWWNSPAKQGCSDNIKGESR